MSYVSIRTRSAGPALCVRIDTIAQLRPSAGVAVFVWRCCRQGKTTNRGFEAPHNRASRTTFSSPRRWSTMDPDNLDRLIGIIDLLDRFKTRMEKLAGRTAARRASRASIRRRLVAQRTTSSVESKGAVESQELTGFGNQHLERLPTTQDLARTATLTTLMSRGRSMAFASVPARGMGPRRKSVGTLTCPIHEGRVLQGCSRRKKSMTVGGLRQQHSGENRSGLGAAKVQWNRRKS